MYKRQILARSVLEMYRFDPQADDTSRDNLMRQSIDLISKFPTIIAVSYTHLDVYKRQKFSFLAGITAIYNFIGILHQSFYNTKLFFNARIAD